MLRENLTVLIGAAAVVGASLIVLWPYTPSKPYSNVLMPVGTLLVLVLFFATCKYSEVRLETPRVSGFFGILTLMLMAMAFLIMNLLTTIPFFARDIRERVKAYKPTASGLLLVIGASAILFGFLDNYGMKLGTDALEDGVFWRAGKRALAGDDVESLDSFNEFFTTSNPDIRALFQRKRKVQNLDVVIEKYDQIKSSSAMLGNTFSDFVGALLGAGINGIFAHLTATDGSDVPGDLGFRILQNPVVRVIMEALFIALGCLVPVGMHFHDAARKLNTRTGRWIPIPNTAFLLSVVGVVVVLIALQSTVFKGQPSPSSPPEDEDWHIGLTAVGVMAVFMTVLFRSFA